MVPVFRQETRSTDSTAAEGEGINSRLKVKFRRKKFGASLYNLDSIGRLEDTYVLRDHILYGKDKLWNLGRRIKRNNNNVGGSFSAMTFLEGFH
jgi:hypothetical protein